MSYTSSSNSSFFPPFSSVGIDPSCMHAQLTVRAMLRRPQSNHPELAEDQRGKFPVI